MFILLINDFMHSNIATNITSCLPHSTLQQLFVAMHVTMAMSCNHKAVSDPDPHLPTRVHVLSQPQLVPKEMPDAQVPLAARS